MAKKKYKETSRFKWYEAVLKLLDGAIDHKEYVSLERRLLGSPADFDEYLELIIIYSCMHEPMGLFDDILKFDSSKKPTIETEILDELAECEKNGQPIEVERSKEPGKRVLTEKEREAKIRAFLREEKALEEQERRLEEEARRKIRERELRRRQRAQMAHVVAARVRRYLKNAAIAAMLMVVGCLLYAIMRPEPLIFVATLTEGINVKWSDPEQPTQLGSQLRPGYMRLEGGIVEMTFDGGAKVIIEAPVEIELKSADKANIRLGKIIAVVPLEARGFTINTPSASIVDLGTEFGVHVEEDGSSDIHVFQGKVSLLAGRIDRIVGRLFDTVEQIVEAGQARRVVKGGDRIEDIALDRNSFVSKVAKTIPFAYDSTVSPIGRILYFPFDAISNKRVVNRVNNIPTGQLIGRASVAMTGDGDENFKNEVLELNGGCVRINALKDQGSRSGYTFVMWIRPDIINLRILNHFFFAKKKRLENYSMAPLEVELYMADDGSLDLLAGSDELRRNGLDYLQVEDIKLPIGSWSHIAAVVSPAFARLYVNGTVREVRWEMPTQMVDRLFSEGSWDILIGASGFRMNQNIPVITERLNGSIDDFAIYDMVLSQEEVTTLYLNTKNDR